jgi:hypothetical protein
LIRDWLGLFLIYPGFRLFRGGNLSQSLSGKQYHAERKLGLGPEAAATILMSVPGARRWLEDPAHPGIRPGALFVVGMSAAEVESVVPGVSINLSFATGRKATIEFSAHSGRSKIKVTDHGINGLEADALASGWDALLAAAEFLVSQTKANRRPRQAVIMVHGIGNQRPQSTLKAFVGAVVPGSMWNKPDRVSDSYELRRYQLPRTPARPRTDFYELYWANKVPGTKLHHTMSWLRTIVFRRPKNVSERLRPLTYLTYAVAFFAGVGLLLLSAALGMAGVDRLFQAASALAKIGWVSAVVSVVGALLNWFLVSTLGDAARYLDPAPDNIAVRQAIRKGGVDLLRRLHTDGIYDRITLVGHSLGSVICYDIVRLYWSEVFLSHGSPLAVDQTSLRDYERLLPLNLGTTPLVDYRRAQRDLWCEYRRLGHPWLITDLITIGSPLTHAGTLMAKSKDDLDSRIADLELPTSPPHGPNGPFPRQETYFADGRIRTIRMPTSASPFALTRWTNLYAPTRAIVFGDPIGGPIAPVFGVGILDIAVRFSSFWRRNLPWAHTSYWREPFADVDARSTRRLWAELDVDSARWLNRHVEKMPWETSIGTRRGDETP